MRSLLLTRIVGAAATLTLLAGCSGGGSSGTPVPLANPGAAGLSLSRGVVHGVRRSDALGGFLGTPTGGLIFADPEALDPAAPKTGVYAGQYGSATTGLGGSISLYAVPDTKNVAPVCTNGTLTAINGIGADATGVLWVPGATNVNSTTNVVYTYAKNTCTQGKTILTETNGQGSDIAFTTTGTIYVLDILNAAVTNGVISVYPKGKTKPASVLNLPNIGTFNSMTGTGGLALGIATDAKNGVYAVYQNKTSGIDITVFANGKGAGKILQTTTSLVYEGLTFDAKGNLLAATINPTTKTGSVSIFKPPYTGTPTSFATTGSTLPVDLKLDTAGTNLYVGDVTNGTIDVYKYPSGTYEYSISKGLVSTNNVEGVAVDPSDNN